MSSNKLSKFDAPQKKAIKWIIGQQFNHFTELEYLSKLKELRKLQKIPIYLFKLGKTPARYCFQFVCLLHMNN